MENSSQKEFSIDAIIPAFNGERFIAAAIDSVLEQTHPPERIIVVNDGSTDATEKIVLDIKKKSPI
jgi:glycosyltransferase involved in cell wall biosynthesis